MEYVSCFCAPFLKVLQEGDKLKLKMTHTRADRVQFGEKRVSCWGPAFQKGPECQTKERSRVEAPNVPQVQGKVYGHKKAKVSLGEG